MSKTACVLIVSASCITGFAAGASLFHLAADDWLFGGLAIVVAAAVTSGMCRYMDRPEGRLTRF